MVFLYVYDLVGFYFILKLKKVIFLLKIKIQERILNGIHIKTNIIISLIKYD